MDRSKIAAAIVADLARRTAPADIVTIASAIGVDGGAALDVMRDVVMPAGSARVVPGSTPQRYVRTR
jgi:hypothetical protein